MKIKVNKLNILICIIGSFSLILSAYFMEYYFLLYPCDLCIKQRIIHFIILSVSLLSLFLHTHSVLKIFSNLLLPFLWLFSSLLAFYHFGIENNLWSGFTNCAAKIKFNKNTLDQILEKNPIKCDEVQFEIFQISLAGWNGLVSFLIFIILLYILYYNKRK